MERIVEIAKQISLISLCMTAAEWLLPEGKLKESVHIAFSLYLLCSVLERLLCLLR